MSTRQKNLLFVTYHDEECDEGLSYAIDLAKIMDEGITILMVYKNRLMKKFDDLMTAITFAEAGEDEIALRVEDHRLQSQRADEETNEINSDQRCESSPAGSESSIDDIVPPDVENKACGKREPDEGRDNHARLHAKSPKNRPKSMPKIF